jgi:hypothetical protein
MQVFDHNPDLALPHQLDLIQGINQQAGVFHMSGTPGFSNQYHPDSHYQTPSVLDISSTANQSKPVNSQISNSSTPTPTGRAEQKKVISADETPSFSSLPAIQQTANPSTPAPVE